MAARLALILSFAAAVFVPGRAGAADALSLVVLSPAQQAAIAQAFSPTLVLHPLEKYFPTSSMVPVGGDALPLVDPGQAGLPSGLETWPARVAEYRMLSQEEKLARAAVGYRVFSRVHQGRVEVVVEYWCYYVYNEFTVRGAWLPYRVQDNHPHDLERLFITLTAMPATPAEGAADEAWARGAFRIRSVIANAHDGSIPPNEYDVPDDKVLLPPVTVLVELGSHAMAPDLNHDGLFTPGIDSTKILKLQWGIRDRGATWGRYRASFMDGRDGSAERLCGSTAALQAETHGCSPYALYPADDLQTWFQQFELSSRDRRDVVGRSSWLVRTFGDIRVDQLMVPTDPPDGRALDAMVNRRTRGEAGFVAGFTTVASPALIVGRRYFWDVPSRRSPDIIAEALALVTVDHRPVVETTFWSSYSIDAITNMLIGVGWSSARGMADIIAGTDLRIGRFRVRPTWRLREHDFNTRLMTTF